MNNPFPFAIYAPYESLFKSINVPSEPEMFLQFPDEVQSNPIFSRMKISDNPPKFFPDTLVNLVLRNVPKNTATFDPDVNQESLFRSGIYVQPTSLKIWVGKVALHTPKPTNNAEDEKRNMKTGDGTRIEHATDRIYRILGVPSPRSHLYDAKHGLPVPVNYTWSDGREPVRISEHLGDDAFHLYDIKKMFKSKSNEYQAYPVINNPKDYLIYAKSIARQYAIVDAFLSARDVHDKNVMFTPHSDIAWRIDNGNALNSTGYGRFRKSSRWNQMQMVKGILPDIRKIWGDTYFPSEDMHDGVIYHGLSGQEILDQSNALLQKLQNGGGAAIGVILKSLPHGEQIANTLQERAVALTSMLERYDARELTDELNRNLNWMTGNPR